MLSSNNKQTIVALSTPPGMGGIAVVRLSGSNSGDIAAKLIKDKKSNSLEFSKNTDHLMQLGYFTNGIIKDKVMSVIYKAPHSYTGEDVVEIQTHGNNEIAEQVILSAIKLGASQAQAGEFTKQAFLNGKLDLTAAEGVIDLIEAQGIAQLNAAFQISEGGLFKTLENIFDSLIKLAAQAEAAIDYPEEDLEIITKENILNELTSIEKELNSLTESYGGGVMLRDGVKVVLCGDPNVGKSKLLNRLLERERAIVSDIAGTTRDTIEEAYIYKGIRFVLCDTAGIRETEDEIEKMGVNRSYKAVEGADIILAIYENEKPFNLNLPKDKNIIYVLNKSDLIKTNSAEKNDANTITNINEDKAKINTKKSDEQSNKKENKNHLNISALTGENVEQLKNLIYQKASTKLTSGGVRINNLRQFEAAKEAKLIITQAITQVNNITIDCIASDITRAAEYIGKITGKTASEEVINSIFERFCVGK